MRTQTGRGGARKHLKSERQKGGLEWQQEEDYREQVHARAKRQNISAMDNPLAEVLRKLIDMGVMKYYEYFPPDKLHTFDKGPVDYAIRWAGVLVALTLTLLPMPLWILQHPHLAALTPLKLTLLPLTLTLTITLLPLTLTLTHTFLPLTLTLTHTLTTLTLSATLTQSGGQWLRFTCGRQW
jgi:hypothetical protein